MLYTVFQYSRKSIGRWFDSGHSDFIFKPLAGVARFRLVVRLLGIFLRTVLILFAYCMAEEMCQCSPRTESSVDRPMLAVNIL